MRLAYIGSIKDDILNLEELALKFLEYVFAHYPDALKERYQIGEAETPLAALEAVARARGCIRKGEELDYAKTSGILFDDFRSGRLGKITIEWVQEQ